MRARRLIPVEWAEEPKATTAHHAPAMVGCRRLRLLSPPYKFLQRLPMPPVDPAVVRRKVWWRIVPLLFVLYIVAYLDRANLGFAKDSMCTELGFSPRVYGWGVGLF